MHTRLRLLSRLPNVRCFQCLPAVRCVSSATAASAFASSSIASAAGTSQADISTLQAEDWDALPQPARTHLCGTLSLHNCNETVALCGWVVAHRSIGGLLFIVVSDWSGELQVVWDASRAEKAGLSARYNAACHIPLHSVVQVVGKIRPREATNSKQASGAIEVDLEELRLLNSSAAKHPINFLPRNSSPNSLKPSPSSASLSSSSQPMSGLDQRAKYRYLDIRQAHVQRILRLRSDVSMWTRQFLWKEGFVEVETPYLFKSTPEGASEFLVPTRKPGKFYALPQSPQQHKQLLMVGGVDKYFQIARCFRDEDGRTDRQPEFTQIDLETSFQTQEQIIGLAEAMIRDICRTREDISHVLTAPIPRMTWKEAMDSYGSDKPDLRFGMKIHDISTVLKLHTAELTEVGCFRESLQESGKRGQIRAMVVEGYSQTNREKKELEDAAAGFGAKGLLMVKVDDKEWKVPKPASILNLPRIRSALTESLGLKSGDLLLVVADTDWTRCVTAMGALRLHLFSLLNKKELTHRYLTAPFAPLWVTDFPLFEVDEVRGTLSSAHHPFTAPHPAHLLLLRSVLSRVFEHLSNSSSSSTSSASSASSLSVIVPRTPLEALEAVRDAGALEDLRSIIGQSYDLVMNGMEMGGGSIRIYTRELQEGIFRLLGADPSSFSHLLEALSLGAPPHGGIAIGLDRLVALLAASPDTIEAMNIREVIAFPKSANGIDALANSPSSVSVEQLARYFLTSTSQST